MTSMEILDTMADFELFQTTTLTAREIEEGYAVRTADLMVDNTQVTFEA